MNLTFYSLHFAILHNLTLSFFIFSLKFNTHFYDVLMIYQKSLFLFQSFFFFVIKNQSYSGALLKIISKLNFTYY
jgi:hypothetical protein